METNEFRAFIELMAACYRLSPEAAARLLQNILNRLREERKDGNQEHGEKGK